MINFEKLVNFNQLIPVVPPKNTVFFTRTLKKFGIHAFRVNLNFL